MADVPGLRTFLPACLACAVLVVAAPSASAATDGATALLAFPDQSGDVSVGFGLSPPWDHGTDLLEAGLDRRGATFEAWIRVADLAKLKGTDVGAMPDTMFILLWTSDGGGRHGEWSLRADYQPDNTPPWSFSA